MASQLSEPDEIVTLDDVAEQLRAWRLADGTPSFTEIARRVAADREARGVHARFRAPGRVTVYDCFADGRTRIDVELVVDIARALGVEGERLDLWMRQCALAQERRSLPNPVTAHLGLPGADPVFVGREQEQEQALAARIVLIDGMAGTGKTQLARRVLGSLVETGRVDGVAVVALGDRMRRGADAQPPTAAAIGGAVLRLLERPVAVSDTAAKIAAATVEALAERRLALLVDDATDPEQLEPFIAAHPTMPIVATSRERMRIDGATPVGLTPWSPHETVALLRTVAGADRIDAEPDAARRIAELLGGLPLAAALTAARVKEQPDWSLADHADALEGRLQSRHLDEPVSAAIALSYATLSDAARTALRLLAVQPCRTLAPAALPALIDADAETTRTVLTELDRSRCILRQHDDRVALHSLVRTYAAARSWDDDRPSLRDEAVLRLAEAMLTRAWSAADRLSPGMAAAYKVTRGLDPDLSQENAGAWMEAELDSLVELAVACADVHPAVTVEMAQALTRYFDNRGRWLLAMPMHRAAVTAARSAGDAVGEAFGELAVGQTAVRLGLPEAAAHLARARDLGTVSGAARPVYASSNALAILAAQSGDPQTALRRFKECLVVAREDEADDVIPLVTDNIAVVLRRMGDLEGAMAHHRESLAHAQSRDNQNGIATSLGNMSEVHLLLGDIDAAVDTAEQSRQIADRLRTMTTYSCATANLGLALAARGEQERALPLMHEALQVTRENSIRFMEVSVLNNIGDLLRDDDPDGARAHYEEALSLGPDIDLVERSRALGGLGRIDLAVGENERGRSRLEEALQLLGSDDVPEALEIRALLDGVAAQA